ncbi:MAG: molybdenum cofactor carrier protein, partial [Deltaproteobacteria bacterium]|nr:molybdenum cofactor carrier protein [Deltaproteobacteria bacterium]
MYSGTKHRFPIVGVMGSGSKAHKDRAGILGQWLAEENVHLLTGGGGGVMEAVSRAFYETPHRKGFVIGILPGTVSDQDYQSAPGYPNPWVEIPIYTHLPLSGIRGTDPMSRNHINILSAD